MDIEMPLHFFSPVMQQLIEDNPGKQYYGNSVRVSDCVANDVTTEKVLRYNHDISRDKGAPLTEDYVLWHDQVTIDGTVHHLAGWFEAV